MEKNDSFTHRSDINTIATYENFLYSNFLITDLCSQ